MDFRKFINLIIVVSLITVSPYVNAQDDDLGAPPGGGPRAQLATIVFAGLGGAILGLSTLSFYGRPQDKLSNIAVGFALGIIGGTIYTTYQTATHPYGGGYDDVSIIDHEREISFEDLDAKQPSSDALTIDYRWEF